MEMETMRRFRSDLGEIFVAAEVIEQLVVGALGEQDELLPPNRVEEDEGLLEALARAYKGNGVEIRAEEGRLKIRLQLIARYGVRIPEAARRLRELLTARLRDLAGLEGVEIAIEVRGVRVPTGVGARAKVKSLPAGG